MHSKSRALALVKMCMVQTETIAENLEKTNEDSASTKETEGIMRDVVMVEPNAEVLKILQPILTDSERRNVANLESFGDISFADSDIQNCSEIVGNASFNDIDVTQPISEQGAMLLEESILLEREDYYTSQPQDLILSNSDETDCDTEVQNIIQNQQSIIETIEQTENSTTHSNSQVDNHINDDINDPDYVSVETENRAAIVITKGRPKKGRKRKYEEQNREIRKHKCNTNKEYVSITGKTVEPRKFAGKQFDCKCPKKCTERVSEEVREKEFNIYWSCGSHEARCAIIQGNVKEEAVKRSYSVDKKRTKTRRYTVQNVSVCKKTFLNTYSISQSRIDVALAKRRDQKLLNDMRGEKAGGLNAIPREKLQEIHNFIDLFPKYVSHYCRENTTSQYLASNLNMRILYDLYKEKHPDGVSLSRFRKCFYEDFNLKFKKPHKDTCLRCDAYKAKISIATGDEKAKLEEEHNKHLRHARSLREQMKRDLKRAESDDTLETLTFDLEKTHSLPFLPTSIVYYKRQLNLYNLGIHCGSNGKGYFNVWLEHEAGRGTQEVGSCIKKFITEHIKPTATELILWSDSCGGQNRSIKMILMLKYILHNHTTLQKITIRFLQPGHTYLPNDSDFGDVECYLKTHNRLYTDEDYMNVMRNCRRKKKFTVTRLSKKDFLSVTPIMNAIVNRKSDVQKNKISWLQTFEIDIQKSEPTLLFFKKELSDSAQSVDISKSSKGKKKTLEFDMELPLLRPDGNPLSEAKVKDLKELVKLVPGDSKLFFNFLKTTNPQAFIDDVEGYGQDVDFEIEEMDV